jgi:glycosyltransferase involved in cell wall biosynthesis
VIIDDLPKISLSHLGLNIGGLKRQMKLIDRYQIDLIHTDNPRQTFYLGIAAKIKKIPLVWHIRASNQDRYDYLLYILSTRLILAANALRDRFDWVKGDGKFVTIHNGVDLDEFKKDALTFSIHDRLGILKDSLLITVIGRLEPLKGQIHLIEACGHVKDRIGNFYVLCVGDFVDSDYLLKCRKLAEKHGLSDRIIFTGHRNDIVQILNSTDVFVLPSLFEAFPRSILEAMATGKPSIVTNVGGCPEAVEDMKSGMIVPPGNPDVLAEQIILLAEDASLRHRLGQEARIRTEKIFSIEQNVMQTQNLYRQLLDDRGV